MPLGVAVQFGFRHFDLGQGDMIRSRQVELAIDAVDLLPQLTQLLRCLFAEIGQEIIVNLLGHRRLCIDEPFLFGVADPLLQSSIEVRIKSTIHDLAQVIRPQCSEGIDFGLLNTECRPPFVGAFLCVLQWCGWQIEIANLFDRQRRRNYLEVQISEIEGREALAACARC